MSSSSTPLPSDTHCRPRVTPGRSSTLARLEPASRLMSDDLPTFGTPTTIIRTGCPAMPLAARLASCGASVSRTSGKNAPNPRPLRQSAASAGRPAPA